MQLTEQKLREIIQEEIKYVNEGKVAIKDLPASVFAADKNDWGSVAMMPTFDDKRQELTIIVHAGDSTVKKYLNNIIKSNGYKTKFEEVIREGSLHYYVWSIR